MTNRPEVRRAYIEEFSRSRCVKLFAAALALTNSESFDEARFDEAAFSLLYDDVCAVTEEYGLSPEEVQKVLQTHEPTLLY